MGRSTKRSPDEKVKRSLYIPLGLWDWLGIHVIQEGKGRDRSSAMVDLLERYRTRTTHEQAALAKSGQP